MLSSIVILTMFNNFYLLINSFSVKNTIFYNDSVYESKEQSQIWTKMRILASISCWFEGLKKFLFENISNSNQDLNHSIGSMVSIFKNTYSSPIIYFAQEEAFLVLENITGFDDDKKNLDFSTELMHQKIKRGQDTYSLSPSRIFKVYGSLLNIEHIYNGMIIFEKYFLNQFLTVGL